MLSVAGADRLQTGMRGAWGKPAGKVARVSVGQILISIRTSDRHLPVAIEALRRSMYKFPGRQKVIVSKKQGFTDLSREDFEHLKREGKLKGDGAYVQFWRGRGELEGNVRSFPGVFRREGQLVV
jgi:large subunit ribosomal protein L10e